ncbi:MAG: inositol monophosphatase family protein [Chloroflexota bacterium]
MTQKTLLLRIGRGRQQSQGFSERDAMFCQSIAGGLHRITHVKIEYLRNIGKRLFERIGAVRLRPFSTSSLGKGASGDKTFPIDKDAEDLIIGDLEALGEPLSILSEEAGSKDVRGGGLRVLIDPIDGSKNAISGVPFYCSSIAVAEGDRLEDITLAYVINLVTGDEFWAERGKGACFNGDRIHTQKDDVFYLIAYEAQNPGRDLQRIVGLLSQARKTRCLGATALDLSYVAYGAVSVFVTPAPSRSFDFAAGWLLVREAGGVVTDLEGNTIDGVEIGLQKSTPLLASGNAGLHEKVLSLLR